MKWTWIIVLVSPLIMASMESNYQAGKAHANALQDNAKSTITQNNLTQVPGFQTANPSEVSLGRSGNLQDAARSSLTKNEAGQNVIETAKTRHRFEIDPDTDPLFKVNISHSTETFTEEQEIDEKVEEEGIEKTCEEGGEEMDLTCHENLDIKVEKKENQVFIQVRYPNLISRILIGHDVRSESSADFSLASHLWNSFFNTHARIVNKDLAYFKATVCPVLVSWGKLNIDCNSVQSYWTDHADNTCDTFRAGWNHTIFVGWLRIMVHYQTNKIISEDWSSNCQTAEDLVEKGLCHYADRILSQGPETRSINGYPVFRDAWGYQQHYQCKMVKDECNALRLQGCYQISSKCKEKWQDRCWIYEQTYRCPTVKKTLKKVKSPLSLFCLSGDCHDTGYQANGEMLDVISRLSLLKKIQDDIRAQGTGSLQIFKGNDYQCSRNCVSFKDCCGGLGGWGTSLRLASCSSEEQQLAKMREQNLCHQIGTYCSKKVLGKCVSKKTSFCCFSSKFGRLLQEQGRPQLGLGWGDAKCPDCRGFTIEELSRLDLSRFDFSEVFNEVMQSYRQPDMVNLQEKTRQKIETNLKQIEKGLKNTSKVPGVLDGGKNGL